MEASICYKRSCGYYVSVILFEHGDRVWKPVRNFGDNQGDAQLYVLTIRNDRWKYEHLESLAKNYKPDVITTHLGWRIAPDGSYVPNMKVKRIKVGSINS